MKFTKVCTMVLVSLILVANPTLATIGNYNLRFSTKHDNSVRFQSNSNAPSGSGLPMRNLRGARLLTTTTSSGTIVYTENGGDSSTGSSSDGSDASQVIGSLATTMSLAIVMSAYLL
ncbi:unnamed protein product [Phytophthora lilii]|uniref:Unnamed protein product n=1 Tax=Phytophthora lilii TaxID=2077276 RepID=A0A9W6TSP3_9STRA|nr:unnamed protein product [Phytophthora lilii]